MSKVTYLLFFTGNFLQVNNICTLCCSDPSYDKILYETNHGRYNVFTKFLKKNDYLSIGEDLIWQDVVITDIHAINMQGLKAVITFDRAVPYALPVMLFKEDFFKIYEHIRATHYYRIYQKEENICVATRASQKTYEYLKTKFDKLLSVNDNLRELYNKECDKTDKLKKKNKKLREKIRELRNMLEEANEASREIFKEYINGVVSKRNCLERIKKLEEEITQLKEDIKRLEGSLLMK